MMEQGRKEQDKSIDPRKEPRQKRSLDTYNVILEAAADLITQHGLEAANTNRIAERAGVSIGSLYQYFPGREAILAALIRTVRRRMLQDFENAVDPDADQSLQTAVSALVAAALLHHLDNPRLVRWLEKAEGELPLDTETRALKEAMAGLVVDVLSHHAVPEPEKTAFDLISMSHGMMHAVVQAGQDDFDDLHGRVLRAVCGYLAIPFKPI